MTANTLEKTFIATFTTTPGYTVRRWHPAVTVTEPFYIIERLGAPIYPGGIQGGSEGVGTSLSLEVGNVVI